MYNTIKAMDSPDKLNTLQDETKIKSEKKP